MDAPASPASPSPAAPVKRRSLLPQEHGAWGQLAMPLISALAVARPSLSALLLTASTVLGFLAHEPWLVTLGHRGAKALKEEGARARKVMLQFLAAAGVTGVAGVWLAPMAARVALVVPVALCAAVIAFVLARKERTVPGELTVVSALASSGFAVALASGATLQAAAAGTATWVLSFAASVFAVQVVLIRGLSKGEQDHGVRNAVIAGLISVVGCALAVLAGLGWVVPAAVAPTAGLSLVVCLAPFSARQLRTLGWALVGSTTATLIVLIVGLRAF